jgi:hypothetical protein
MTSLALGFPRKKMMMTTTRKVGSVDEGVDR